MVVKGRGEVGEDLQREPFNSTPMAVNSISSGSPHVRCTPMGRTCGEPDEIKKNTHPKFFTALFRERTPPAQGRSRLCGDSCERQRRGGSLMR